MEADYLADITYVGNYSPHKERWLQPIANRLPHLRLCIIGAHWDRERGRALKKSMLGYQLNADFYAHAVQYSRINLAVHGEPDAYEGWQDLVSTRTFEIPACKGFMLHIDNAEVRGLFEAEREIALFASEEELILKIEHYLANTTSRSDLIERAYQ